MESAGVPWIDFAGRDEVWYQYDSGKVMIFKREYR
jgi:hypothetical protein